MAGDGILSIGATVDKTGVDAGLSSIQDGVQTTVQSIAVQVEETCARTKAAWNKLGDDVKAAAQSVSSESLKVAEATKAQTAALADLRRASVLSKDAKLDEATSTGILAAAQVKVAAASAAVAAAKKEEAAAVATATEEEALSSNVLIAAFQRAAMGVRESCTSIQEKLVETAETGKLSAEGLTAGFAGLGSLLGAGIFVGFAAHFLDETSKMEIELSHLHEKTGIAIQDLAGLQQIVRESGADWDAIATGLVRMDKALADSNEPSKALVSALGGINLKIDDLKGLQPEVQLQKIATAFAGTENAGNRANAAIALFGRGGQALIPILVSQGAALHANIDAASKLTGVTDESVKAAFTWQQTTARLSAEFRRVMVPTIEIVEKAIAGLLGVIKAVDATIWMVIDAIGALAKSLVTVGGVIYDAMTGNFGRMKTDAKELTHDLAMIWEDYGTTVAKRWKETAALMTWQPKGAETPGGTAAAAGADPGDDGSGGGSSGSGSGTGGRGRRKSAAATSAPAGAAPGDPETQSADLSGAGAEMIAQMQAEVKAKEDAIKQEMQADRDAAEGKIRLANESYAETERTTEFDVRMGTMSAQQRTQVLSAAAEQQKRIVAQLYQFIEALDMGNARQHSEDLQKDIQATQQWAAKITQVNQQAALQMQQRFQQMFQAVTGPMNTFFDHWLTSGRNMGQAFAKMGDQIAMNFINSEVKMLEHHLQMEIQKRMITATSNAAQVASTASATAATTALDTKAATQSLSTSAAKAAGKAWSALSDIPVVGPALGAAAAAATYAGVMALAAFEQGGIVGGRGAVPILAHAGERVLSQSQTQNFESMVNQSTSNKSSEVHFHDHSQWSGIDGASVEGMYKQNAAAGRRQMMRQLRLANQI
jgi:hypothetical protein